MFRLFGYQTQPASAVSDEEIKTVVAEAESAGVIETGERRMIAGVLRLGDRDARGIMTPRTDVHWIDLEDDEAVIRQTLTKRTTHACQWLTGTRTMFSGWFNLVTSWPRCSLASPSTSARISNLRRSSPTPSTLSTC